MSRLGTQGCPDSEEVLDELALEAFKKNMFHERYFAPIAERDPVVSVWSRLLKQRADLWTTESAASQRMAEPRKPEWSKSLKERGIEVFTQELESSVSFKVWADIGSGRLSHVTRMMK